MKLSKLYRSIPGVKGEHIPDVDVTGVVMDSRQVQVGGLFVALQGERTDGHHYIPQAIQQGAGAIVGTQPISGLSVPYLRVKDGRKALAFMSAAWYDFPARKLVVIGVTGTDGKTTTANLIFRILQGAGLRVGMISTVNAVIGDQVLDTGFHVTTPESSDVQRYLAQMVDTGLTHVILEATSHGLTQQRVTACDFDIGVVTNITHEHLDFHGDFEAYREAKGRLFTSLGETVVKPIRSPRAGVLNRDDSSYEFLARITKVDQLSYGITPDADVRAEDVVISPEGLSLVVIGKDNQGRDFTIPIISHLVGEFNVPNILAAAAVTHSVLGLAPDVVQNGIVALRGIPGRMETLDMGQDFLAIVDFAHTPNALRAALESARKLTDRRVIAVFGSAGLRDRAKRWMMAEISADLADLTLLTAEDPRTESLGAILAEMAAGVESRNGIEGETYWRVPDRRAAIRFGLELAETGDLVIVCGKGHEQSMCFGDEEYAWDDRLALRAALAEYLGVPGPEMPFLPEWD